MKNNKDTGALRATLLAVVVLFIGVFLVGIVSAETTTYTPTTTTVCDTNGLCTATIYSGIENIYENDKWINIERATSLKDSGIFEIKVLETDEEYPLTVIDYNMTSITLDLDHWSFFNDEVDIRIWKANRTKEEGYNKDVKDGKVIGSGLENSYKVRFDKVKHDKEVFNVFDLGNKKVTYTISPGDIIEFGPNSTTIVLQTVDSENLGDTLINNGAPTTNFGTGAGIAIGGDTGANRWGLFKFNVSSLVAESTINSANLSLYMDASYLTGGVSVGITTNRIYDAYAWNETDPTWNTRPTNGTEFNVSYETIMTFVDATPANNWYDFKVTDMLQDEITSGPVQNLSIYLKTINSTADDVNDVVDFRSRNHATAGTRPKLQVTYTIPGIIAPSITFPVNGTTYNQPVNYFNWSVTNTTALEECKYSLNGAANTTISCLIFERAITSIEGLNNIILTINDSTGTMNSTQVYYTQAITNPNATISYPTLDAYYNTQPGSFNWSITNYTNLDVCQFSLNGAANTSVTCSDYNYSITSIAGLNNIVFTINDSVAGSNFTSVNWTYDSTLPVINFTSETSGASFMGDLRVNVSSSDSYEHFTFLDINNDVTAWIRMDDLNSSGSVVDYFGRNNGTIATTLTQTDNGRFGKAFEFNRSESIVLANNLPSVVNGSISAWVNFKEMDSGQSPIYHFSEDGRLSLISVDAGANLGVYVSTGYYVTKCIGCVNKDIWDFFTLTWESYNTTDTNYSIYHNGAISSSGVFTSMASPQKTEIGDDFNGSIDEVIIFNRTLNGAEILALYNSSANQYVNNFTDLAVGDYNYTAYASDRAGNINLASKVSENIIIENSIIFNSTSYETTTDGFILNVSSGGTETVTASFWYNNTQYATVKNGNNLEMTFTSEVSHSVGDIGNNTFYWTLSHGSTLINSTLNGQDVQVIAFGPCNSTLVTPFLNFTFKDEDDDTFINSTFAAFNWVYFTGDGSQNKSFSYDNSTEQESYSFCGSPNFTYHNNATITYGATGYPQRVYSQSADVSNQTQFVQLYLLNTADGDYVTFQLQDAGSKRLDGVTLTIEKLDGGVYTTIGQDITDSAGLVTFFLNPDLVHRITAVRESYTTYVSSLRPTQSIYTIVLEGGEEYLTHGTFEGINYRTYPATGFLTPNTTYTFGFNVTTTVGNMTGCKLTITNSSLSEIGSATGCGTGGYGGNITLALGVGDHERLFGNYYVNLGSGYELLISENIWTISNEGIPDDGAYAVYLLNKFSNYTGFGNGTEADYNRITFFFILLVIALGLVTKFSGIELTSPGYTLVILNAVVILFSVSGVFTARGIIANAWLSQYVVAMTITLITMGFLINQWRVRAAGFN